MLINPINRHFVWLIQLGPALGSSWIDIMECVEDMHERGKDAILMSEWNAETKKLVVKVIDKLLGTIKKEEDVFVEEDEILKLVPKFYTEEEANKLIRGIRVNKRVTELFN